MADQHLFRRAQKSVRTNRIYPAGVQDSHRPSELLPHLETVRKYLQGKEATLKVYDALDTLDLYLNRRAISDRIWSHYYGIDKDTVAAVIAKADAKLKGQTR